MNHLEAIQVRVSRRKYSATPIDSSKVADIKTLISQLNAESGLHMTFVEDGAEAFNGLTKSYGLFSGVRSVILLKGAATDPHLLEKCGYYGEQVVLEATQLGLGTCWVAGTYDTNSPLFKTDDSEKMVCVLTIGNVASEKSFGEKLISKLAHRKTKPAEAFYEADTTPPDWFLSGISAVQKAPSAMNTQKFHFTLSKGQVHGHIPNTYSADMIDLGIAKYHFELAAEGKFELGNDALLIK